jgi:3',5'-cyclic AMP phosphodiesterase CpdA
VYVLPGNHDIMNPFAARFTGKNYELIESITPKEFADIYNPFGYQEAIYRHAETLSYAAEPVEGVWLVAVDTNTYLTNQESGYPWSSGEIGIDLYYWLEEILGYAKEQGKKVIAAMHHPVIDPSAPCRFKHQHTIILVSDTVPAIPLCECACPAPIFCLEISRAGRPYLSAPETGCR